MDPCLICGCQSVSYDTKGNIIERPISTDEYSCQQLFTRLCSCLGMDERHILTLDSVADSFPFCDQCEELTVTVAEMYDELEALEVKLKGKIVAAEKGYIRGRLYDGRHPGFVAFRRYFIPAYEHHSLEAEIKEENQDEVEQSPEHSDVEMNSPSDAERSPSPPSPPLTPPTPFQNTEIVTRKLRSNKRKPNLNKLPITTSVKIEPSKKILRGRKGTSHFATVNLTTGNITYETCFGGHQTQGEMFTFNFTKLEEGYKCTSCSKEVEKGSTDRKQITLFRKHTEKFHPPGHNNCKLCGDTVNFETKALLTAHIKTTHNLSTIASMKAAYYLRKEMSTSGTSGRGENETTYEKRQNRQKYSSVCPICGKLIATGIKNNYMNLHLKRHLSNEEKPFLCSICGKTFPFKWEMEHHISKNHPNGVLKMIVCQFPSCGVNFQSEEELRKHVPSMHNSNDEKILICQLCGKTTGNAWIFKEHKLVHSKEKCYECPVCSRKFSRKSALSLHLAGTHSQGELYGEFKCTVEKCGLIFQRDRNRKHHMRRVHGIYFPKSGSARK